jgi:hypothetical protein
VRGGALGEVLDILVAKPVGVAALVQDLHGDQGVQEDLHASFPATDGTSDRLRRLSLADQALEQPQLGRGQQDLRLDEAVADSLQILHAFPSDRHPSAVCCVSGD